MKSFYLSFYVLAVLAFAFLTGCNTGVCKSQSDCRLGQRCDIELSQCVNCLSTSDCGANDFCCQGECKNISQIQDFCGCGPRLNQTPGSNCGTQYNPLYVLDVGGPMCLTNGSEPKTPDMASKASCSCDASQGSPCGEAGGLKNLCVDRKCVVQNAEHCGETATSCITDLNGTLCLPPRDGTEYGVCGCDASRPETFLAPVENHVVANRCENHKRSCGSAPPCALENNSKKDCCDDQCRDFKTDPKNCGTCRNSCATNECYDGQCVCSTQDQCDTLETNLCAVKVIQPGVQKSLCACSDYQKKGTKNFLPCPAGSFCCASTAVDGPKGCCSKSCDVARASDCRGVEE